MPEDYDQFDEAPGDEEYEYEYEESYADDDDEGFEEYEDDFGSSEPSEVKVKTLPGLDAFALVWSFCATLAAICLVSWILLYEVYDWRVFDVLPRKEPPAYSGSFSVLGIGRDASMSDTTNYIMVDGGTMNAITPGTILWVFPDGTSDFREENAVLTAVVSEDCRGRVAKAWITEASSPNLGGSDERDLIAASDFRAIPEGESARPLALRNIWLTRGDPGEEGRELIARPAPWSSQRIVRGTREQYGSRN